ncbi:hypothetical protein VKT23_002718 [Stygiomarasmius scandens]|uniref:Uncharacterized protein n=1 Tax=Marasmiellus scandens TaxID=2682957 RepID=A0ABR1K325_9AGAR
MKEEEEYLQRMAELYRLSNPPLALQIQLYANVRGRYNDLHRLRLRRIPKLHGFDSVNLYYFYAGVGLRRQIIEGELTSFDGPLEGWEAIEDVDSDVEGEEEEDRADRHVEAVLRVANDP